jgi:hypothetical protein
LHINVIVDKVNEIIDAYSLTSIAHLNKVKVTDYNYRGNSGGSPLHFEDLRSIIGALNNLISEGSSGVELLSFSDLSRNDNYKTPDDSFIARGLHLNALLTRVNTVFRTFVLSTYSSEVAYIYDMSDVQSHVSGYINNVPNIGNGDETLVNGTRFNVAGYKNVLAMDASSLRTSAVQSVGTNNFYFLTQFIMYPWYLSSLGILEIGSAEYIRVTYAHTNSSLTVDVLETVAGFERCTVGSLVLHDGLPHTLEITWERGSNPVIIVDGVEKAITSGDITYDDTVAITPDTHTVLGSLGNTNSSVFGAFSFAAWNFGVPSDETRAGLRAVLSQIDLDAWRSRPFMTMPSRDLGGSFFAIVGEEFKIHKNSFVNQPTGTYVDIEMYGTKGEIDVNGDYVFTPEVGDIGVHDLNIMVKDQYGQRLSAEFSQIEVIAAENGSGTKNLMMIGDSLTAGKLAYYDTAISDLLDHLTINYIGTQGTGPYLNEGHSGKTFNWMVDHADSPFTKAGVLDIPAYFTDNTIATPDFIHILLSVNDAFSAFADKPTHTELAAWSADIDALVDGFLAQDAGLKIILALPPTLEATGAGWYASYGTSRDSDLYMYRMMYMRHYMAFKYDAGAYDARVSVIHSGLFLDRINHYNNNNGVHPSVTGYDRLGRALSFEIERLLVP